MRRHGRLRWLLLPVETKHRELDAKLWLGCCAAERGYGVILGEMGEIHRNHLSLPRGICLDKSIAPGKTEVLRGMRRAGHVLCVNDEEALMAYNYPQRYLDSRLNRETLAMTRFFFAWGERHAELVRRAHPEHADRVHTVGNPRVDLLATGLRSLYAQEAAAIRSRYGRYILLPSNFCDILHVNGPDYRLKQAREAGLVRDAAGERLHAERRAHRERVLEAFVAALEQFAESFPEHALVVRPHPADDASQWRRLTGHIPRCQVRYEGTAIPWLLGADAIVHNGCTTAVEACLLGKRPVSYHPFWDDRFEYHFQARIGPSADNPEALLDMVRARLAGGAADDERRHGFEPYIRVASDGHSAEATLDLLDDVAIRPRRLEYTWLNPYLARSRLRHAGKRLERRVRKRLRRQSSRADGRAPLYRQKWPETTPEEMRERLARLRECSGRFAGVDLAHLTGHLFVLVPEAAAAKAL